MINLLHNIDLPRLAGRRSILGIDITRQRARVVELKRNGFPLLRSSARYTVENAFSCEFLKGSSFEQKGQTLRNALNHHHVRTKSAVTSLRTVAVKTALTVIPDGVDEVEGWIRDHTQKILKLPIPISDLTFQYEFLEDVKSGTLAEVTFVRRVDVEQYCALLYTARLEPVVIGAGVRDLMNNLILDPVEAGEVRQFVVHVGADSLTLARVTPERREGSLTYALEPGKDIETNVKEAVSANRADGTVEIVRVSSDFSDIPASTAYELLTPFGLESQYALAAGLALKGFLPEVGPVDFLPPPDREALNEKLYRSLFQRVAIACGSILLTLLLLPFVANFAIQKRIESEDKRAADSGALISEVKALEEQVATLEGKLHEGPSFLQRTNSARVLHDVAGSVPPGIRFTRLTLRGKEQTAVRLSILGTAKSNDLVTTSLRNLQATNLCTHAKVVKIGNIPGTGLVSQVASHQAGRTSFALSALVKF